MKATLEFDLDDPTDKKAHTRATTSTDAYLVIHDIDNYLRNEIKYREHADIVYDKLVEVREKLSEFLINNNINMDNLE